MIAMVKLHAYNTYNASAVFEVDSKLFFIESPYTDEQIRPISERQLEYLLTRLEYFHSELEKVSLLEVVDFVKEAAEAARPLYKISDLTEEELIAGFETYPEEMLVFLVDDLRARYFDKGKYTETLIALRRYWKVGAIRENETLRTKLVALDVDLAQVLRPVEEIKRQLSVAAFPIQREKFGPDIAEQVKGLQNLTAA